MLIKYLKFLVTRLFGTGVDTLVLWVCSNYLFTSYWGSYILSPIISFEFAVISNFLWSYYWIWNNRVEDRCNSSIGKYFLNFNLSAVGGFLIKMLFLLILESIFGWDVVWCNLMALIVSGFFNYFMADIWVFRKSKKDVTLNVDSMMNCMNENKNKVEKPGWLYRTFWFYLRFFYSKIFYKRTYKVNGEVIPENGTPLLIVSNHQNCLNDPLGLVFSFSDRKPYVITRADVFTVSSMADKFLRAIGLLPAFRLDYDGEGALGKNAATFQVSEKALIDGRTVIMYPEAKHQDKHWLGKFSYGYTKMAFEAAEMGNFEKDILILPACNHYSHYFGIQNQMLVKFGTPISIQPYYELYRTKPRTAQREVNRLVRDQISDLMLDIRDLDNYDAIDFIRTTYGEDYAQKQGVNPYNLPERLLTDKDLVAKLDEAKIKDEKGINEVYKHVRILRQGIEELGITDNHLKRGVNLMEIGFKLMLLLILLPLWIFSWWPSMPIYWIPMSIFNAKMKDPMFKGTLLYGSAVLFTLPFFSLITLLVVGCTIGWLSAIVYVALFPLLMVFCWKYAMGAKRTFQNLQCLLKPSSVENLKRMRKSLHEKLNNVLNK